MSAIVVGVLVAVVVGVGRVDPAAVLAGMRRIGPGAVALATLAVIVQMLLIGTRLWFLLPAPRPRWPRVAYAFSLGQVINNFLPVRSGDVLKVAILTGPREVTGRSAAEIAGVLIADALVDTVALTLLLLCVGPSHLVPTVSPAWSRIAVGGGAVTAAVLALVAVRRRPIVKRLLAGLRVLREPRKLAGAIALSTGNWTAEILALRLLTAELGTDLGVADAIRVLFLFNLGIVVPVSIANLGTFEVPIAVGLGVAGVTFADGLAIGTAYHGLQILGIALLALVMVIARRLRPGGFTP